MNCRECEFLILAERDGALTETQHAALSDHVASCASCHQRQISFPAVLDTYQTALRNVPAPSADEAWRELQERLPSPTKRAKTRPLAPVLWFGAPLAAAAAIALALQLKQPEAPLDAPAEARAEFVETGNPAASTLIYVDKESGWLVVWAVDNPAEKQG